jgi:hypothetical protein
LVETSFPDDERLERIPCGTRRAQALGVWVVALCHSRLHELGGFCPMEVLQAFVGDETIQDLVDVGLFTRGEEDGLIGVVVINYAQFNGTKSKRKGMR